MGSSGVCGSRLWGRGCREQGVVGIVYCVIWGGGCDGWVVLGSSGVRGGCGRKRGVRKTRVMCCVMWGRGGEQGVVSSCGVYGG